MPTMLADGHCLPFDEFMDWALYDPQTGYYSQPPRQVFGKRGDFFTASQLQPAFGRLMAALIPGGPVLELGPGGGEMRQAFGRQGYVSLEAGQPLPPTWSGAIFANEFLDALPVTAGIRKGDGLYELSVRREGSTYHWQTGKLLNAARRDYVERYYPGLPDGARFEIAERSLDCIRRLSACLLEGTVWIIDYGWAGNEWVDFPEGTLMSYRKHRACTDVLRDPGRQDITAHVPFTPVIDAAREAGFAVLRFEALSKTLANALDRTPALLDDPLCRAQVKTLLFGMGEKFRTLVLAKPPHNEKGPGCPEPHVKTLIPNGT